MSDVHFEKCYFATFGLRSQSVGKHQIYNSLTSLKSSYNLVIMHKHFYLCIKDEDIPAVNRPDRKNLLDYLNGKINTCPSINKTYPLVIPTQVKRPVESDGYETLAKKSRSEDVQVQKVKEQLAARSDVNKKE